MPTVFNITSYNLVCKVIMIVWIHFVILVTMVIILAGKYGLPSYQNTSIYKMEICMSGELSGHQHSDIAVTILNFDL